MSSLLSPSSAAINHRLTPRSRLELAPPYPIVCTHSNNYRFPAVILTFHPVILNASPVIRDTFPVILNEVKDLFARRFFVFPQSDGALHGGGDRFPITGGDEIYRNPSIYRFGRL
jgi:hypothetical protein